MAVVLSLVTAVCFGTGDFLGGMAAKRAPVLVVVACSHLVGLVGVFAVALVVADEFRADDLLLGAIAGGSGGVGVALLYRGLARGPMSVVAPLTAITSAAVPAVWGVFDGERLGGLAWVGVALALFAIGLVSTVVDERAGAGEQPVTARVVAEALTAGAGFGLMFIVLDATDEAAAPWPIVGARLATVTALFAGLVIGRRLTAAATAAGTAAWLIVGTGVFDTASNVVFLFATNRGLLTLVAVISSLYPVATVILARLVLHERMSRHQQVGFVLAMAATALIAAG